MLLLIVPIIFFAIFVQAAIGFGSGLIAMPLLIGLLGLDTAAPAFALLGQTAGIIILFRYRASWSWKNIWHVSLASLIGIPLGVWGAHQLPEHLVMVMLGVLTLGYAIYSLLGMTIPRLRRRWGMGLGFAAGLLHGAYNTGGPPLVIYGTSQRWNPESFKGNIQSLFFINGLIVLLTHYATGHITGTVLSAYAVMLPAMLLALFLGFKLDGHINPSQFRTAVLVLLVILGLSMIF